MRNTIIIFIFLFIVLAGSVYGEEPEYELVPYGDSICYLNNETKELVEVKELPGPVNYELRGKIPQLTDYKYSPFYSLDNTDDRAFILLANKHKPDDYQVIDREDYYKYFQIKNKFLAIDCGEIYYNPEDCSFTSREGEFYILNSDTNEKKFIENFWEKAIEPLSKNVKKAIKESGYHRSPWVVVRDAFLFENKVFLVIDYGTTSLEMGEFPESIEKKLVILDLNSYEIEVKEEKFYNYISSYKIDDITVCFTGEMDIITYDLATGKSQGFIHRIKLDTTYINDLSHYIIPLGFQSNIFYFAVNNYLGEPESFEIYGADFYYFSIKKIYSSETLGNSPFCCFQKDRFVILYNPADTYYGIKGISLKGKDLFKIQESGQVSNEQVLEGGEKLIFTHFYNDERSFYSLKYDSVKPEELTLK